MAPYSPPTGGRSGKLRLDFNENTVGCSPRVIEFLQVQPLRSRLGRLPRIHRVKRPSPPTSKSRRTRSSSPTAPTKPSGPHQHLRRRRPRSPHPAAVLRHVPFLRGSRRSKNQGDRLPAPTLAFPLEELLDAITPATRAILISNPNNPTGTGDHLLAIEQILEPRPQAAVLIDEAYYEFCGVTALPESSDYPNLFVSRTFSKVYGMAAMRIGCLFSQAANVQYLHKAQSPYSVNMLAALAAEAAVGHRVRRKLRRRSACRTRTLCVGLEKLGIATSPARRTSFSAISATAPSKSATPCATKPSSCATAATKFPAASASP